MYFGSRPLELALPHTAPSASTISKRPLMIRAETNRGESSELLELKLLVRKTPGTKNDMPVKGLNCVGKVCQKYLYLVLNQFTIYN
jgi:hypothetical protein